MIVAGALAAGAASPRAVVPRYGLHSGDGTVGQLADPAVEPCLHHRMVPVVLVAVGAQKRQEAGTVGGVVIRLDIAFQVGIVGTRIRSY